MTVGADTGTETVDPVATEVVDGLTGTPRRLAPRWLYDQRGSELFSEITTLPEYYQTETERRILVDHAGEIARATDAATVIELGSGTSDKTRTLLDAFEAHGSIERFVPLDVSDETLLDAAAMLRERHDGLEVEPVVGDFTSDLGRLRHVGAGSTRLAAFLGGTIGNFDSHERSAFLGSLRDALAPGDWILIGIDQVKPIDRLVAAYDDSQGVTEAFIRNALANVNATYDGDIDVDAFEYAPLWDARAHRIDMRLRAQRPVGARLEALDLDVEFAAQEEIRIEISTKFSPADMVAELAAAGFDADALVFTDDADDFALVLARRT